MPEGISQRNAVALYETIQIERRRMDEANARIVGLTNAIVTLRAEVETLRGLVHASRGTGPSVKT